MGKMQRNKRIMRECAGKARPKRHGIGKMSEQQWFLHSRMLSEFADLFAMMAESHILYGDQNGQHMTGIMGAQQ